MPTGQKVGKANYDSQTRLFVNVSPGAIEALWESFNDVSDGFGISSYEMQVICQELASELEVGIPLLNKKVEELFVRMDSDRNALVDAVEFLAAIAIASGMSFRDKLEFVFTCFDFDGAGQLSIDEITLALQCTLAGSCKLTGETCPPEAELEAVAMRAFDSALVNPVAGDDKGDTKILHTAGTAKLRILVAHCAILLWVYFQVCST